MRTHHRNFPYRPPRKRYAKAPREFYLHFLRTYVVPHLPRVALAFVLIGASACTPYLMALYGRIVVDKILAVEAVTAEPQATGAEESNPGDANFLQTDTGTTVGLARTLDAAELPARPPEAGRLLLMMFFLYLFTTVALNSLERLAQRQSIAVSRTVGGALREDMHDRILELSVGFHQATTPGRLLARITSDVEVVQNQTMQAVLLGSRSIVMLVVGFVILFLVDWRIGLAFFCIAPLYALIHRHFRDGIKAFNRELRHTNSCLYGLVTQKIEGVKVIQAYAREGLERLHMHRLCSCFLRDSVAQQGQTAGLQSSARIVSGLTSAGIFVFTVSLVMKGRLSLGEMLLVHGTVANLFMPVMQITQLSIIVSNMQVTLGRMVHILQSEPEITEAPDAVPVPIPLKQGIEVHSLSFSYGSADEGETVLKSVDLVIPAGSWVCLMGASGSGKSTLLYLLSRLYEPSHGMIRLDGIPIDKLKLDSMREHIGFVPQTPQIFSGTVRDNIVYGKPEATPTEIMAAAGMAEMHDFILQMPVQYETLVGERGTTLSGGQRQRLALARALLTDPEILLLDDCTSALDANTERKIQETLARNLSGKTAVIASQRVSMAKRCDRIAVLENGIIGEYGTHEELLDLGGFYARLHAQQTEGPPRTD